MHRLSGTIFNSAVENVLSILKLIFPEKIAEDAGNESMSSTPLPLESVAHLSSAYQDYFLHWSKMLRLESEESQHRSRSISDIWCIDPVDREAQGNCISFLKVFLLILFFFFSLLRYKHL
jgi:hypothetical protein